MKNKKNFFDLSNYIDFDLSNCIDFDLSNCIDFDLSNCIDFDLEIVTDEEIESSLLFQEVIQDIKTLNLDELKELRKLIVI